MSEIASRVKAIIVDKLGVDENQVTPAAAFTTDLGADSLDTVELIMEFEKEFGITIPMTRQKVSLLLATLLLTSKLLNNHQESDSCIILHEISPGYVVRGYFRNFRGAVSFMSPLSDTISCIWP